jgi:hypothetical protein
MAAGVFNFSGPFAIKLNSDFNYTLTYTDQTTGQPINLTGYEAKMSFGNSIPATTVYLTLESTGMSPAITFNAAAGEIFLNVPQVTVESSFGEYLTNGQLDLDYDMLLYPNGGGVDVFLQGTAIALDGITTP